MRDGTRDNPLTDEEFEALMAEVRRRWRAVFLGPEPPGIEGDWAWVSSVGWTRRRAKKG